MTIHYLIIDDEPAAHKLIERFAKAHEQMLLMGHCYNAIEAAEALADNSINLIFLDINMPQITGFELLQTLPQPPQIIVVSAHQEYALESYEYEITDYLLKPFNAERFHKAIQKVSDKLALKARTQNEQSNKISNKISNTSDSIFIKDDKMHHRIHLDDILYIKANGNYTSVYLKESHLLSQMKISDFEKLLPQTQFSRVHRSYVIAHQALTTIKANEVHINDTIIPVGRVYKEKTALMLKTNSNVS